MNREELERLEAYESLLNILPNADPDYLRQKCDDCGGDKAQIKIFVENALEVGNYPTYEDYTKRVNKARLQREYRENFKVKEFLEVIPDPVLFFRSKRSTRNKGTLEEEKAFLRSRYSDIGVEHIEMIYKREDFNLYKTCKSLDSYEGLLVLNRDSEFDPIHKELTNKELLQEIAFIIHEEEVVNFIEQRAAIKNKALERAKRQNTLLTCNCCYDDSLLAEDMAACSDGHLSCKSCIRTFAEVQIGRGKSDFPCLVNCGKNFLLSTIKMVLPRSIYSKMSLRQQAEEIRAANIKDLEFCPFCDFGAIPEENDIIFKCLNSECMQISCRLCKEPNHIPLHCDELPEKDEQVKLRTFIEDRMTQALLRECYKCKKKFVKSDGCNKMTCSSCGAIMCYICKQPVKDYSHFNGQGGNALHKCPLWTKNEDLHEKAVAKEALKAKEEALSRNPTVVLKHDPTMVLP